MSKNLKILGLAIALFGASLLPPPPSADAAIVCRRSYYRSRNDCVRVRNRALRSYGYGHGYGHGGRRRYSSRSTVIVPTLRIRFD